jgi:outer membrane protein with beta-barrel domain
MNSLKALTLSVLFVFASIISTAQIFDKYGLRTGIGISNLKFTQNPTTADWANDKIGYAIFLNAEKKISRYFSIRPELGYLQKGSELTHTLNSNGIELYKYSDQVTLHNLSLGAGLKISSVNTKFKLYAIAGIRAEYYFDYGITTDNEYLNSIYSEYSESLLSDFNKVTLTILTAFGLEYDDKIYLEMEYNPSITNNLKNSTLKIRSRYYGITLGVNISEFVNKK